MRYHAGKLNGRKRNCVIKTNVSLDGKGDSSGLRVRCYQKIQATKE